MKGARCAHFSARFDGVVLQRPPVVHIAGLQLHQLRNPPFEKLDSSVFLPSFDSIAALPAMAQDLLPISILFDASFALVYFPATAFSFFLPGWQAGVMVLPSLALLGVLAAL